jgi:two-component system response regulator DctR
MKAGARDFLEKPFSDNSFVDRVVHAMRLAEKLFETSSISSEAEDGMSSLTSRERTIAEMIALGRTNRAIGDELSISTRTVEAHRAKIFEKLNVKNAVELVRRVQRWPRRPSGSGAAGDPTSEPSR